MTFLKKNGISISLLLLVLSIFISGCQNDIFEKNPASESYFHVQNGSYSIPVLVRGNTAAGKIFLFIQGGPGLNTLDFATIDYPEWKETLEKDYAVAYYDQRGTGNGQGNFDSATISIEYYIEDLHQIALFLEKNFDAEVIFLGHSFGGSLIYRYLIEKSESARGSKYIVVDGPASNDRDSLRGIFRRDFLLHTANLEISKNRNQDAWLKVLKWLDEHPVIEDVPGENPWRDKDQWNAYVDELIYPYYKEKNILGAEFFHVLFSSSYNPVQVYLNSKFDFKSVKRIFNEVYAYPLSSELYQIQQDILLITGRYDDICPPEEMSYIYDHLGSPNKRLEIIEDAGHESFVHQPELFFEILNSYIQ